VAIDVAGRSTQTARTGSDGRAQFAHLPIGANLRATVTAQGTTLESETFPMPADRGVRLLFVVGEGAAVATRPATTPTSARAALEPAPATAIEPPPAAPVRTARAEADLFVVRTVVIGLTILSFIVVAYQRTRA